MAKRKAANKAGTIKHRADGRWEGQVVTGRDPATGKLKRKSIYAKTQKDLREKMTELTAKLDSGCYVEASKMTLEQWLSVWLETYTAHLAPRTLQQYRGYINGRIVPVLGKVKLSKLDKAMIQSFYNTLSKEVAPKTVGNIHGILHGALRQAVDNELIPKNPAERLRLPKIKKPELKPFSDTEIANFLHESKGTEFEYLFQFALFTGMRMGEIRGLTWDRVDFENQTIVIDRQLQPIEKVQQFIPPKHGKSRVIFPPASIIQLLHRQHILQMEWKMQAGELWEDNGFVFSNEVGRYVLSDHVYKSFKKIASNIGRPDARPHDLRHTYACNALKAGIDPKTLSESLGHHSVAFTLDVYAFALDEMKKAGADKMEQFIQGFVG